MQILDWKFILLFLKYQKIAAGSFSSFIQEINPKEESDVFLEVWSFQPIYSHFVLFVSLSLLNIFIFTFNQKLKLYILPPSEGMPRWIVGWNT